MNELHAILDAWENEPIESPHPPVLATVVGVRGSAYRRPGARMLMVSSGRRIGSVSGGCLEGDLSKKAWWLTEDRRPVLRTYDTTSEEEAVWEFGLGCNGVVEVLLERLDTGPAREAMRFLQQFRESEQPAVMVTAIRSFGGSVATGDRLCLLSNGDRCGSLERSAAAARVMAHAQATLRNGSSSPVDFGEFEAFVERLTPPARLIIFGAGHDAPPLVRIATELGWRVTVADGRANYARPERFPGAERVVLTRPGEPLDGVEAGPEDAVVLMTHSYPQDRALLEQLIPIGPKYLGVLGPRSRTERLLREMGEGESRDLHAPVGLDIGADTPESIALAIAAEVQAALSGRSGGMLKFRPGPIYSPAA